MNYTNLRNQKWYIEPYINTKINVSTTSNQSGVLYVDENNNSLYTVLHLGNRPITKLVGYSANYYDSLLIYNDTEYALLKDFITDGKFTFNLQFRQPTKYRIGARRDRITNSSDSPIFTLNLTGRTVFKVILNNVTLESSQYTANSIGVTILATYLLNPIENAITIIYYTTTQTITKPFYLGVMGVTKVYDIDAETCNPDFFDNMIEFNAFEDPSDSINKTFSETYKSSLCTNHEKILNSATGTLSINFHDSEFSLKDKVGNKPFRVLAYDQYTDRLTYYPYCTLTDGVNKTYGNTNNFTTTINVADRVEVYGINNLVAYGEGLYGEGLYSMRVISELYGSDL